MKSVKSVVPHPPKKTYHYPGIGSASHKGTDKYGIDIWLITISCGFRPDGSQHRHRRQVHGDDTILPHEIAMFYAEVQQNTQNATRKTQNSLTVAEWAEQYLALCDARCVRGDMAPRTVDGYRQHLRDRILPALGQIHLDKLAPKHLKTFLRMLATDTSLGKNDLRNRRARPLAGATQLRHFNTLRALLQEAVYEELIPSNPADQVRAPRVEQPRPRYFRDDTLPLILTAADTQPPVYRALWYCAIGLGLRRGELAGLRWSHVDWKHRTITIEQSVQYRAGNGQQLKGPKSKHGYRVLPIPLPVIQALEYNLVQQRLDRRAFATRAAALARPRRRYRQRLGARTSESARTPAPPQSPNPLAQVITLGQPANITPTAAPRVPSLNPEPAHDPDSLQGSNPIAQGTALGKPAESSPTAAPRVPSAWIDSGAVFINPHHGNALHVESIGTAYGRFIAAHRLPDVNLHGLRHTAISLWQAAGLTDTDTAALAGHSPAVMRRIYSHPLSTINRAAADVMEQALSTKLSTKPQKSP